MTIRLGTRGSALALAQAEIVKGLLDGDAEITILSTAGDRHPGALPIDNKGMFVDEIRDALDRRQIDIAVHSAKDLPTATRAGITIGAVPAREDARDALVTDGRPRTALPVGATVGTSSLRRAAVARSLGLTPVPIRGNVDTRLRALDEGRVDALVLACAGLKRLGLAERITEALPPDVMLPAPAQGALVIECRSDDAATLAALAAIEDVDARTAVEAERAFMELMGGDCRLPLGALAVRGNGNLTLRGLIASVDGTRVVTGEVSGSDARGVAVELSARLLAQGAGRLLQESLA